MRTKKGFIFSVVVVSFMLLLMLVAALAASEYAETERIIAEPQSLLYASSSLRDAGQEYADALLPSADYTPLDGGSVHLRLADSLPRVDMDDELASVQEFEQGTLSQLSHATISADLSNVTDGAMDARLMDRYGYASSLNHSREMHLRTLAKNSSTGMDNYSIYVNVDEYRAAYAPFSWNPSGDISVTLVYTDRNGTMYDYGALLSTAKNMFSVTYDNGRRMEMVVGRMQDNESYWYDSVWMNLTNDTEASFIIDADAPSLSEGEWLRTVLPIPLSFRQGNAAKDTLAQR